MAEEQKLDQDAPEDGQPDEVEEQPEAEHPVKKTTTTFGGSRIQRLKNWCLTHKKWSIPASVMIILIILAAIPWTRYNAAGLVIKRDFSVQIMDATAHTPVSGATVSLGSISAQTDATGKAVLRNVKAGHHLLQISKKYYQSRQTDILSPIFSQKTVPDIALTATGRQVKITVSNLINKTKLANVGIKVAGISAKTDSSGSATVVLPVGASQQKATLSLAGYNDASVTVQVSNDKILNDNFTMTPAGKVYFLSNLSGNLDVVKTNLDGTDRQTVLAGTGNEDENNTVLLASRDWKYLALLSRRAGNSSTLYLIDTSNDSVATIDEGDVTFTLVGWSDDYFTYVVSRPDVQPWQPGAESIKSYDAQTKKLSILDSTSATGSNLNNATYETYIHQPILLDNLIVYTKTWYQYPGYLQVSGQSNTLNVVKPDGTGKKTIKSLDAGKSYFGSTVFHSPDSIYVQVSNIHGGSNYYEFNGVGLTSKNNLADDIFEKYPTYLYSPDDKSTFWSEPRDGKNTLFVGDASGGNGKQIATLSDYNTYGWYTDNYLLVSKDSSELYIMPVGGSNSPIKISDYHKPQQTFNGYGGGYGGL